MSLSTSLRFESNAGSNSNFKKAYLDQVERIKCDELMADRQNVVRLHKFGDFWDNMVADLPPDDENTDEIEKKSQKNKEKNINQRAEWNENLEEASWKKRIKNEQELIKGELRMAAKASLAIRRMALKQLLERELAIYEKELSISGKTFFKQRI